MNLLSEIAPRYQDIATGLKIPLHTLGLPPHQQSHQQNLRTVLEWWLDNGNSPVVNSPVTWGNIISVVEGPLVKNYRIAKKMRKFCQSSKFSQDQQSSTVV